MKLTRYIIIIFCLLLATTPTALADRYKDSILSKLSTLEENKKVEALNNLSEHLLTSPGSEAMDFAKQALNISDKIGYDLGKANSFILIGRYNAEIAKYDIAFQNLKSAMAICEKIEDFSGIADINLYSGTIYRNKGDLKQSLKCLFKAAEIYQYFNKDNMLLKTYTKIALNYMDLGRLGKSIEYNHKALLIAERTGNMPAKAKALHCIGLNYFDLNDYEKAIDNLNKAYELYRCQNNLNNNIINDLAITYSEMKNFDKALYFHNEFLKSSIASQDSFKISIAYLNIGRLYIKVREPEKAKYYLLESQHVAELTGDKYGSAEVTESLGEYYFLVKNYKEALSLYEKSLEYFKKEHIQTKATEIYKLISDTYLAKGEPVKALEFYKINSCLKDSINEIENNYIFAALESKEIADWEMLNLRKKIDNNNRRIILQRNIIIVLSLVNLISIIIYNINNKKNRKIRGSETELSRMKFKNSRIYNILTADVRNSMLTMLFNIDNLQRYQNNDTHDNLVKEYDFLSKKINSIIQELRH
jgi:tetratricopeptide (TPR) repeat protein